MKGMAMELMIAVIIALIVALVAFGYWSQVKSESEKAGPGATSVLVGGFALLGNRRKGISEATTLILVITMALLVAFVLFALFGGLSSQAPSAAGGMKDNFFDAIIRNLPSW